MRYSLGSLVLFAACAVLVAAPVPKEKPAVKDEEAILGTWSFEKIDSGDAKDDPPSDVLASMRLEFKKDGWGPGPLMDERMDPERIVRDAQAAGLRLLSRETFLRYQYMLVFTHR